MSDEPLLPRIGLFCAGYGVCRLPHGHLHRAGRVVEIRSMHHGQPHVFTMTLDDLAATVGCRLVPLVETVNSEQ